MNLAQMTRQWRKPLFGLILLTIAVVVIFQVILSNHHPQPRRRTRAKKHLHMQYVWYNPLTPQENEFVRNAVGKTIDSRLLPPIKQLLLKRLRRAQSTRGLNGTLPATVVKKILHEEGIKSRLPDVIMIGAKKTGTNALKFYLEFHPQLCVTGNEVHYYDRHDQYDVQWYKSRLRIPKKGQLVLEKTPKYFVTKSAPSDIKRELASNIKFILSVRDPVERLISDFRFTTILETKKTWRRKQSAESQAKLLISEIMTAESAINSSHPFVYTSDYALHFKEWLKYFKPGQFLIIENSEMKANVVETLHSVERFLGIDHLYTRDMFAADGMSVKVGKNNITAKNTKDPKLPYPAVSKEVNKVLRDYYQPKNLEFERLAGRSFPWSTL